jgi:hypothetical protein
MRFRASHSIHRLTILHFSRQYDSLPFEIWQQPLEGAAFKRDRTGQLERVGFPPWENPSTLDPLTPNPL